MSDWPDFGLDAFTAATLRRLFAGFNDLDRVWIYGSRARGDHRPTSDIDLVADAPDWDAHEFSRLWAAVDDQEFVQGIDLSHWQRAGGMEFRQRVERDRQLFWAVAQAARTSAAVGTELKPFQETVLARMTDYLLELKQQAARALPALTALRAMEGTDDDLLRAADDYPRKVWAALKARAPHRPGAVGGAQ